MITIDTWAVIAVDDNSVIVECPFMPENGTMTVPVEEIGKCNIGDILSTETGGWFYLREEDLKDLNDTVRKIFEDYLNRKGFVYYDTKHYGFIAG
ncbi:MAG: hypothetical protein K2J40_02730 [Ruminococcus sp.]|nr:hypothetical protein [Ruminococcus sp.]